MHVECWMTTAKLQPDCPDRETYARMRAVLEWGDLPGMEYRSTGCQTNEQRTSV